MNSKNGKLRREIMPPIITICVMLIIVCTSGFTRINLVGNKTDSPMISSKIVLFEEDGLNDSEKVILSMLMNLEIPDHQMEQGNSTYSIYFNTLKKHLSSSGVDLDLENSNKSEEKVREMMGIMNLEKEWDLTKMSLDGRGVAINISEQIYKLCGLKLAIDMEGNIEQISDLSGNIIYLMKNQLPKAEFQVNAFIITLITIFALIGVHFIIIKKIQIVRKKVPYDGFDEERFA